MDNRYSAQGCPALHDYRFLTNYQPARSFEQFIRNVNQIGSAQDYKSFLEKNGTTIMSRELAYFENNNTCSVHGVCVPLGHKSGFETPNVYKYSPNAKKCAMCG
jgi:hypothetical protein